MDNRLTKRRLSDMLAYDWIVMIVTAIAVIIVWELIYTVAGVRLTVGQEFKFYYDINIEEGSGNIYTLFDDEDVFSYDVLSVNSESLTTDVDVLTARLSVYEGDVLVTDFVEPAEDAEDKSVRLKTMVDNYGYSYEQMLKDAKAYLSGFMKDGVSGDINRTTYNLDNLDAQKIEQSFRDRMKKDNRYRKEAQILDGVQEEKGRIEKLYLEVVKFDYLLSLKNTHSDLFYNYTRYEQAKSFNTENGYDLAYQRELDNGRENDVYALKLAGLANYKSENGKEKDPSAYFKMKGKDDASNVAIMVFNFREQQPHLQYEVISFINAIVSDCSNIYDIFN